MTFADAGWTAHTTHGDFIRAHNARRAADSMSGLDTTSPVLQAAHRAVSAKRQPAARRKATRGRRK